MVIKNNFAFFHISSDYFIEVKNNFNMCNCNLPKKIIQLLLIFDGNPWSSAMSENNVK